LRMDHDGSRLCTFSGTRLAPSSVAAHQGGRVAMCSPKAARPRCWLRPLPASDASPPNCIRCFLRGGPSRPLNHLYYESGVEAPAGNCGGINVVAPVEPHCDMSTSQTKIAGAGHRCSR
jgi:hypothetical protein